MNIHPLLAGRTGGLKPSPIRKLSPLMRMPGMISLGGGYPNAQTFAFESLEVVFKSGRNFEIRDKAMDLACQYGPTGAHADLKPHIIKWHAAKDGVEIISEPAYPGALGAFREQVEEGMIRFARMIERERKRMDARIRDVA